MGPSRLLIAEPQRLGYHVEEWRVLGRSMLVITQGRSAPVSGERAPVRDRHDDSTPCKSND
jgi:hypothetical protein